MATRGRHFFAIAAFIGGPLIAAVCIYAMIGNPIDPFDNRSFSSNRWIAGSQTTRARMAQSAVRNVNAGSSESQIATLLGQPDFVIKDPEDDGGNPLPGVQTWAWSLGSWSRYGFDDAYFYVSFDHAGRVIRSEVNGY